MSEAPDPLTVPALTARHGFFTRQGGVSTGPFASLNCSLSGADARAAVLENRARVAAAIGVPAGALLGLRQVHGTGVITVTEAWDVGAGPAADAMVCARPGIALGIITADCAPVLFADPVSGVVGAAHAGWRGALAGVLEDTVAAMLALGAQAARIVAAIGPCIQPESYEVGAEMRDAVLAEGGQAAPFFQPAARPGHFRFDLPGYCLHRLRRCGVAGITLPVDTLRDEARFFSHRRRTLRDPAQPIGHQISVITA